MNGNILNLKINFDTVLARMGANKYKTKIDDKIKTSISEMTSLAKKLLQPKYAVCIAEKKVRKDDIVLDDFIISSKDIYKLLEKSNFVCGLIATIGMSMDTKISSYLDDKQIMEAFILDSIGSVAVEELVNNICNDIKTKYEYSTLRFSPGYGDWNIRNQPDFLKWLGADKIGVTLSPSYQMIPRKSVSAIFGIRKTGN